MPSQATVTGKSGPSIAVTSKVFTNVVAFSVSISRNGFLDGVLHLVQINPPAETDVDISVASTFTCTLASGVYTIVIG